MKIFIIAGEKSGDMLGAKLMQAIFALEPQCEMHGVGGQAMEREGLNSLFPMEDIAVMGITAVLARAPDLLARIAQTARAVISARPDALVIIDSPDFTHRVARKVRAAAPNIPIIDYVSPSVWAWRPGRAAAMRAYVDQVLAILPFEPAVYTRLHGPPCLFVGHPLIEQLDALRPDRAEAHRRKTEPPVLLILPGSRRSEITRLMPVFGEALHRIAKTGRPVEAILPAVSHLEGDIVSALESWPCKPRVVLGDAEKLAAFRRARAALAASGTVTLELGLAGVPMAVAYKVSALEELLKYLITVPSIVLTNLILGENIIPEFLQKHCEPTALAEAMIPLLCEESARKTQINAFAALPKMLASPDGAPPSEGAAKAVLALVRKGRG